MSLKVKLTDFSIDSVYHKIKKIYFDLLEERDNFDSSFRRLDEQQINHQIYLKFLDLVISRKLLNREKIQIFYHKIRIFPYHNVFLQSSVSQGE